MDYVRTRERERKRNNEFKGLFLDDLLSYIDLLKSLDLLKSFADIELLWGSVPSPSNDVLVWNEIKT